jgi:hypothetical protein
MAGRPITNNSKRARQKREQMRKLREANRVRPVVFNPQPLAKVVQQWSKQ